MINNIFNHFICSFLNFYNHYITYHFNCQYFYQNIYNNFYKIFIQKLLKISFKLLTLFSFYIIIILLNKK
nr:MAG TPA: hypothetical protein [Caudoviricetes sp.]